MRRMGVVNMMAIAAIAVVVAAGVAFAAGPRVGVKKVGNGYRWTPGSLTIKRGTTVQWSWRGKVPHNVTAPGFHSRTAPTLTYSHRFTRRGRFQVVCTIHVATGQKMTVTVR